MGFPVENRARSVDFLVRSQFCQFLNVLASHIISLRAWLSYFWSNELPHKSFTQVWWKTVLRNYKIFYRYPYVHLLTVLLHVSLSLTSRYHNSIWYSPEFTKPGCCSLTLSDLWLATHHCNWALKTCVLSNHLVRFLMETSKFVFCCFWCKRLHFL